MKRKRSIKEADQRPMRPMRPSFSAFLHCSGNDGDDDTAFSAAIGGGADCVRDMCESERTSSIAACAAARLGSMPQNAQSSICTLPTCMRCAPRVNEFVMSDALMMADEGESLDDGRPLLYRFSSATVDHNVHARASSSKPRRGVYCHTIRV